MSTYPLPLPITITHYQGTVRVMGTEQEELEELEEVEEGGRRATFKHRVQEHFSEDCEGGRTVNM